jgi:hypothetical protein
MKRTALALTLISAIMFLAVAGTQFVDVTLANPSLPLSTYPETPDTNPPSITIQMPEHNKTYNGNTVPYSITIEKSSSWFENDTIHGTLRSVGYILDGKENVTIADSQTSFLPDFQSETRTIRLRGNFSGLSEGSHTIQVWVNSVSIYHPSDTPQNFYGWWAAVADYPLDTLSDIVNFSKTNLVVEPEPEPFPTSWVVAATAVIAIVAAAVLVYFKKVKKTTGKAEKITLEGAI